MYEEGRHHLWQDFSAVKERAARLLLEGVLRFVKQLGVSPGEVDHYVASIPTRDLYDAHIESFEEKLGVGRERMKFRSARIGYCGGATPIVPEPLGGANHDPSQAALNLGEYLVGLLGELRKIDNQTLLRRRYGRLRAAGCFHERSPPDRTYAETSCNHSTNTPGKPDRAGGIREPRASSSTEDRPAEVMKVDS
jgi:hypothetical protein